MASRKGGSGVIGFLKQAGLFILLAGLVIALLRVFNWDPFGILEWAWQWIQTIVYGIADFLTGNDTFRKITEKP